MDKESLLPSNNENDSFWHNYQVTSIITYIEKYGILDIEILKNT